ncbi:MAG: class I SAM-dependent methyltransferase [Acidimicrobiia bacterium]|nr:class I SAM-dependent methyltransferase [Acidimicrobiia bacterium]MBV8986278.1 class I SAM-dependent methyltransferase [Acidimicrobiia bacterium]MBV9041975.1 class I SAM-dependent methyltransferase [Acidimicrobiia bacterium]
MTDHPDFEASYHGADAPPWDIGRPQPALEAVADQWRGRVLDAGCGTGEHALLAAARGLEAVGVDAAPTAVSLAGEKARGRGLAARFVVGDALDLGALGEEFDTVVDCGLFHTFDDGDRTRYVASLAAAVVAGGRVFLMCFSDRQPGDWGPRRITKDELRASFADGWRIDAIDPVGLDVIIQPDPVQAWLATITRLPEA